MYFDMVNRYSSQCSALSLSRLTRPWIFRAKAQHFALICSYLIETLLFLAEF